MTKGLSYKRVLTEEILLDTDLVPATAVNGCLRVTKSWLSILYVCGIYKLTWASLNNI